MGFFSNIFKKVKKAITRPISKIFKGVGWIGSLNSLQSGDGYWFQANTNVCFQYECSE